LSFFPDEIAGTTVAPVLEKEAVSEKMAFWTTPTSASSTQVNSGELVFSSLALELEGGATDKIKGKVWANKYLDVDLLLSVTPGPLFHGTSILEESLGIQLNSTFVISSRFLYKRLHS